MPQIPHIAFLGLLSGSGKVSLGTAHGRRLTLSEHLLVDLDDSPCYRRPGQMPNPLPSARSFATTQDLSETAGELRHVRLRNVTPVGIADDFADISHIGRDDRQIAGHGLLDDIWRAFLIR